MKENTTALQRHAEEIRREAGDAPIRLMEARRAFIEKRPVRDAPAPERRLPFVISLPSLPELETAPTPKRDAHQYNKAQANEKPLLRYLLFELCQTISDEVCDNHDQVGGLGRPRILLRDLIYILTYKVYANLSGRRFMYDMKDLQERGFITRIISYNSLLDNFQDESLTPILSSLVEGVAASFAGIETRFAVDATGFKTSNLFEWYDSKYRTFRKRHDWVKVHACCGVLTKIISRVEVTRRNVADSVMYVPLIGSTAEDFQVNEVSADRAYSTVDNLEYTVASGAFPAIPFKSNANPFNHAEGSVWREMFYIFALNQGEFRDKANRQSHSESTFSMIKRKFGERLFSRVESAQTNEALCKILCHNICVLIYWMYEFGIEPGVSV